MKWKHFNLKVKKDNNSGDVVPGNTACRLKPNPTIQHFAVKQFCLSVSFQLLLYLLKYLCIIKCERITHFNRNQTKPATIVYLGWNEHHESSVRLNLSNGLAIDLH